MCSFFVVAAILLLVSDGEAKIMDAAQEIADRCEYPKDINSLKDVFHIQSLDEVERLLWYERFGRYGGECYYGPIEVPVYEFWSPLYEWVAKFCDPPAKDFILELGSKRAVSRPQVRGYAQSGIKRQTAKKIAERCDYKKDIDSLDGAGVLQSYIPMDQLLWYEQFGRKGGVAKIDILGYEGPWPDANVDDSVNEFMIEWLAWVFDKCSQSMEDYDLFLSRGKNRSGPARYPEPTTSTLFKTILGSHSPDKVKEDNSVGGPSGEESSLPQMMSFMTLQSKPTTSTQHSKVIRSPVRVMNRVGGPSGEESSLSPMMRSMTLYPEPTATTPRQSVKSRAGSHSPVRVKEDNSVGGRRGKKSSPSRHDRSDRRARSRSRSRSRSPARSRSRSRSLPKDKSAK